MSILILLSISVGNAEDNNLFIMDYQQVRPAAVPNVITPSSTPKKKQTLTQKASDSEVAAAAAPTPTEAPEVRSNTEEGNSHFTNYDYWDLGAEEHLVKESEVMSSEVKTTPEEPQVELPEVIHVRPKARPTPPPKKEEPAKPAPKPAPAPPKETKPKAAGGF